MHVLTLGIKIVSLNKGIIKLKPGLVFDERCVGVRCLDI